MPRTAEATTRATCLEPGGEYAALRRPATRQATTRRAIRQSVVLLLGFSLSACGPVYLHDPAGEAAATAARTQFQEALVKGRLSDLIGTYSVQNIEQAAATHALQKDDIRRTQPIRCRPSHGRKCSLKRRMS